MPMLPVVLSRRWQSEVVTISPNAWRAGRVHEIVGFCTGNGGDAPGANNLSFRCPDVACGHQPKSIRESRLPASGLEPCRNTFVNHLR